MSSIVVAGDTSGSVTLQAPAVAGASVLTLPVATDTLVGKATTDTLTNKTLTSPTISGAVVSSMGSSVLTSGTAVASTSGTSIDFTGIPSWAKRITVMFNGVSTNATSNVQVQVGTSGGVEVVGYLSQGTMLQNALGIVSTEFTSGFVLSSDSAAIASFSGIACLCTLGSNIWVSSGVFKQYNNRSSLVSGTKTLSGTLDRIRITTVNGTDTFDAGSINIMYE